MVTITDPTMGTKSSSFKLGMLLNDTRYRSLTFQFIALVAIIAFMAFVGGNLVRNLAEAGLNISYGFLGEPAGYDINQRPIEYTSQSTHGRSSCFSHPIPNRNSRDSLTILLIPVLSRCIHSS